MSRNMDKETQAEIDAWLEKGNKITVCEPGARSDPSDLNPWGKKKKAQAQPVEEPVIEPKE